MARTTGKRLGVWIILGFLFVGLIGFGSTGLSGNVRTIGKVGDKPVPVQQYANALSEQIRAFEAQVGQRLGFPMIQSLGLDRAVLSQLIATRAIDNEVARLGLSVGDARIAAQVRSIPAFQGLDGSFDREAYRFTLDRNGLSEAAFETSLREDLARSLVQRAVIGGIPDAMVHADRLTAYIGERRDPTWIALTAADLTAPLPDPSEEELRAFYEANPDTFTAPEVRRISYASMTPERILDEMIVDDQAVRDLYDQRIDDFVKPERRLVERLVMPDQAAADAARAALDAGETDFEAMVAARGLDLTDTDMGDVSEDQLGAAGASVFAATPGDVVGPVETSLGPAFFRLNAVLAAEEVPFEDAAPALRDELAMARARRTIQDQAEGITDLIAGGASIEDLAERTALKAGSIAWSMGMTDDIAAYDAFRSAAAAATEGAFPELIDLSDGGVFALRLDGIDPPALRPFEEVRDEVIAGWQADRTRAAVQDRAEALAAEIRETGRFRLAGRVATVESGLTRRDFVPGTPPAFMTTVFEMAPGEVRVLPAADGAVVVRLDAIQPADLEDPLLVAERASIAERVAQGIAQDIYGAFSTAILADTTIRIDDAAVNAVHANFQ